MSQLVNPAKFRVDIYNLHGALFVLREMLTPFFEFCDDHMSFGDTRRKDLPQEFDWIFEDGFTKLLEHIVNCTHQFDPTILQHFCEHKYFNCTIDNPGHSEMAKVSDECYTYYYDMSTLFWYAKYNDRLDFGSGFREKMCQISTIFSETRHFYISHPKFPGFATCGIPVDIPPRGLSTKSAPRHEYDE